MGTRFLENLVWVAASFLVFGGAAEIAGRSGLFNTSFIPLPSDVVRVLVEQLFRYDIQSAIISTLLGWAVGMALATVAGIAFGITLARSRWLGALTRAPREFLRPVPPIILLPLVVLLLGPTNEMKIVLVFLGAFWPILYQTAYGVREIDPVMLDTALIFRIGHANVLRHIVVPSVLPLVITGIRLAAGIAFVVSVVTELVGSAPGIGRELISAQSSGNYVEMYALIAIAGLLGLLVNGLVSMLEARILYWHPSQREKVAA